MADLRIIIGLLRVVNHSIYGLFGLDGATSHFDSTFIKLDRVSGF